MGRDETRADIDAIDGEPQFTASGPLASGFFVALVSEEVGADESAVFGPEEDLRRPTGKGRHDDHGLPGGRRLR